MLFRDYSGSGTSGPGKELEITRTRKTTNYFKSLSRKDYIVKASNIISEEGIEAVSIRRIATELGCSSTSMYRYFKNLDELLFYTQLTALNEYILQLSIHEKNWKDNWEMYFEIWHIYAIEAFRNPYAFEYVFYRNIKSENLEDSLKDYYAMFPDTIIKVSPLIQEMLEVPGYYDRDFVIWKHLVKEKEITEENARKLNHIFCNLFLGYFKALQEQGLSGCDPKVLTDQFVSEIREIAACYTGNKNL